MSDFEDDVVFVSVDEGELEIIVVSKLILVLESKIKDLKREKRVSEDNNDRIDSKSGNIFKLSGNEKKKEIKIFVVFKFKESVKLEVLFVKKQEEKSKGGKGKKKKGKQIKVEIVSQDLGRKIEKNLVGDIEEKEEKLSLIEVVENLQKKDELIIDSLEIERKLKIFDFDKFFVSEIILSDDKVLVFEIKEVKESYLEEVNLKVKFIVIEEKIIIEVKKEEQFIFDKERKEILKGD